MRIRSTKPEFWRSERIASVDWDARLVLKGLESYVDDNGVGKDDIALVVGDVFPRDLVANSRETVARVSEAISQLHQAGLVWRYEAAGTRLLYVSFWESIQRIDKPGKGRFPRPDGTFDYKASEIRESVASPPETLAPVTEEQRNRGTGADLVTSQRSGTSALAKVGDREKAALRIVNAWGDSLDPQQRPKSEYVRQITAQVQALVNQGYSDEHIRAGMAEWWEGKYPPTTLPNYVVRAQQGPKAHVSTGTSRAMQTMELVRHLEQEESTDEPF